MKDHASIEFGSIGHGTPEDLGLEPTPGIEEDPNVGGSYRYLLTFFGMEYYRQEHRILLEKSGALPTMDLPKKAKSPARFIQEHGRDLFGSDLANIRQIGSVQGAAYTLFMITADVLTPALVGSGDSRFRKCFWCPRSEIVRFKTLQSILIALSQTRLEGWSVDDDGTDKYKLGFKMVYYSPDDVTDPDPLDPHERVRPGGPEFAGEKADRLLKEDIDAEVKEGEACSENPKSTP